MYPENSIKVAPDNARANLSVREEFPVKYERWRVEREDKAIKAVEEANLPKQRARTNSEWEEISSVKERKLSSTMEENSFNLLANRKKKHRRRQSLPIQLEDFQQQHGFLRPRVSKNAPKMMKSSIQNQMPSIDENTTVRNLRRNGRGRRQSLSILDTKKFPTNLKHLQNIVVTSDESEDEFPDYFATIPKIRHKVPVNFCKEQQVDPLKKITRRIFVELDEDCDGYLDKYDMMKVSFEIRNYSFSLYSILNLIKK